MHGFCGEGHGALRWVIGIILLILAFWLGTRVSDLKYEMYGGYGYGSNMMYGRHGIRTYYDGDYGSLMMQGYALPTLQAPAVEATPTTTKTTKK